jgi:hypothetical protein
MQTTTYLATRMLLISLLALGCGPDAGVIDPGTHAAGTDPLLASQRFSDWSEPVNLGSVVNSSLTEFTPEISHDGVELYFASGRQGPFPAGTFNDLWVSRRACTDRDDPSCAWEQPVNLGATVNSSTNEAAPFLSRDGHQLFFNSSRLGPPGFGSTDLYVSRRPCRDVDNPRCVWQTPVHLGAPVNTLEFEGGPTIHGSEFYFNRGNVPNAGQVPGSPPADIFVSRMQGHVFLTPAPVVELNSSGFDQRPRLRVDGLEILLSSDREGGRGSHDIWASTRQGKGGKWSEPVNLGARVNSVFEDQNPALSADGTTLFFASRRPALGEDCSLNPNGLCDLDLYVSTREVLEED